MIILYIAVWNNKGGAGKTTLTFHLSTEYAIQNPDKNIIVIDICPQGNISAALLSNLDKGMNGIAGDAILQNITSGEKVQGFDKTVCGYLLTKIDTTLRSDIPCESFLVQPSIYNKFITDNMYLLCGDPYLEVIAKRLEQERQLMATRIGDSPWKRVTLFIKDFIDKLAHNMEKDCIVFIDTNPSFSVYTEMAIGGAKRVIVPINADDFSRVAVSSMLYLLYGIATGDRRDERYYIFKTMEFSYVGSRNGIAIPKIHLTINNKVTTHNTRSAKAFSAKAKEVSSSLDSILGEYPHIFVSDTKNGYECVLNDFHTRAVQCLQLGCPLSRLPNWVVMHGNEKVHSAGRTRGDYLPNIRSIIDRL